MFTKLKEALKGKTTLTEEEEIFEAEADEDFPFYED